MISFLLPRSRFGRNVTILAVGTALAQVIPAVLSPVLTRLYSPADFGLFGIYFSILMVASVVICGRYEMAILLPKTEDESKGLLHLSVIIAISIAAISSVLLAIFREPIVTAFKLQALGSWLHLIPVSLLVIGSFQALSIFLNRQSLYSQMASARILRAVISAGGSIVLAVTGVVSVGLIIGDFFGQLAALFLVLLFAAYRNRGLFRFTASPAFSTIRYVAKRYRNFPLLHMPATLLDKFSNEMPVFFLNAFFSNAEAGYFTLAARITSIPVSLVSVAIGEVFRQQATSEYVHTGACYTLLKKTSMKLLRYGIVPFILLFILSPDLFAFFFGKEWVSAGLYSRAIVTMVFLQFCLGPVTVMFIVAEKQKTLLMLNIFLFVFCTLSFLVGKLVFNSATVSVLLFSACYSIYFMAQYFLSVRYSKGAHRDK